MENSGAFSEKKSSFFDADSYVNTPDIELAWVGKAAEHMEIHYNLITSVPPRSLKLTPHDDKIYNAFIAQFPNFKLDVLEIDSLKSEESKEKWRKFCEDFRDTVEDATFGTLVRIDSSKDYSEENTILVLRVQFLAIEIARNRLGLNDGLKKL
ncbi:protein PBDC1-like [Argiope bruennichi]|uniref:protein PBDC1-like n=1 Tax=Argiope bruennichi TaxID=94029 RepID=UPI00249467DF|nr:protein PBDC1-like [Argiope bruennichi]XP_055926456.1 protein PBDC1-like [Argiope bruennichi]